MRLGHSNAAPRFERYRGQPRRSGTRAGIEQRLPLSNSSAFTLIALICSVLPFVERCMSHSDLEMAHGALAGWAE
jgi:hypothetical protein